MSYHYTPTPGEHTADYRSTPIGGLELFWEIPIEVEPTRPASMSGPEEGGVYPSGEPVLVRRDILLFAWDKNPANGAIRRIVLHRGQSDTGDAILDRIADEYPLTEGEVGAAIQLWISDDEQGNYAAYHRQRAGDI